MKKDLTQSPVARSNILNNPYALAQLEKHLALEGLTFENELLFTKLQTAQILAVDERTIDRYIRSHSDELKASGYRILKGKSLKNIKLDYVDDNNVVDIIDPKAPALGVFTFRAVLNVAMLGYAVSRGISYPVPSCELIIPFPFSNLRYEHDFSDAETRRSDES